MTQATTPTDVPTSVDTSDNGPDDDDGVHDNDGAEATLSKPPGLGSIPSEPRLSASSIGIDLVDDDGIDETSSEPPGISSIRLSIPDDDSSIAPLGFHDDYGIKNA